MKILSNKAYKRLKDVEHLATEVLRVHDEKVIECTKLRAKVALLKLELMWYQSKKSKADNYPAEIHDKLVDHPFKVGEDGRLYL